MERRRLACIMDRGPLAGSCGLEVPYNTNAMDDLRIGLFITAFINLFLKDKTSEMLLLEIGRVLSDFLTIPTRKLRENGILCKILTPQDSIEVTGRD